MVKPDGFSHTFTCVAGTCGSPPLAASTTESNIIDTDVFASEYDNGDTITYPCAPGFCGRSTFTCDATNVGLQGVFLKLSNFGVK